MRATAIPAAMACMYMAVAPPAAHAQGSREASAEAGLSHLRRVQDEFHSASLGVYADVSDAGNHFEALSSFAGGGGAATVSGSATVQPRSGATCVRCTFTGTGADF